VSFCIKPREEGVVVKPETTSENPAPEIKAESDISTLVGKTDGENTAPAPKVVRFLLCFDKNIIVINHAYK